MHLEFFDLEQFTNHKEEGKENAQPKNPERFYYNTLRLWWYEE